MEKRSGCGHRSDSQKPGINHIYWMDSYYRSSDFIMARLTLITIAESRETFCLKDRPCHDKIWTPVVRIQSINMIDSRLLRMWSVATSRSFFHPNDLRRNNSPRRSIVVFHSYLLQQSHFCWHHFLLASLKSLESKQLQLS